MASKIEKCLICKKSLGTGGKKEVTTSCSHTFHRECAEQQCTTMKLKDCPKCDKMGALKSALKGDAAPAGKRCDSSSSRPQSNHEKPSRVASGATNISHSSHVNTKDKDEDEWTCPNCTLDNLASARRCEACGASKQASVSAVNSPAAAVNDSHDHAAINRPRWNKPDDPEWTCDECEYANQGSDTFCRHCKQKKQSSHIKRPLPPTHHSSVSTSSSSKSVPKIYPEPDDDSNSTPYSASASQPTSKADTTPKSSKKDIPSSESPYDSYVESKPSKGKLKPPTPPSPTSAPVQYRIPVYISDLPTDAEDDHQLASDIRRRVEKTSKIQAGDIRCYSKLGVGVMYVSSDEIKDHLIEEIGQLALHPKEGKNIILFVKTLELVSYIVIDIAKEKTNPVLPTAEEISRRWADLNQGERPLECDQLNVHFPNIYRLVSTSLDQLISSLSHQDFKIKTYFARIYFCADCSFLEDLPRSTTNDQLQSAIANAIKEPHISSSSLYIQFNKQAGNACIIAADTARKWAGISHLYLGDKSIPKKQTLTCRLLIHPIPPTLSSAAILTHSDFFGKATVYKQSGDSLILDITDKKVFDECIRRGAFRVANKYTLSIDAYSASSNPEGNEINGETWYDVDMLEYKPDIMQFVTNPEHNIFRYKWNAKIWIEQFEKASPQKFSDTFPKDPREQRGTPMDQLRHLLQMTVMLNTLGVLRKKSYFIKDREVKLNLKIGPKTIVYNHQSKLEKGGKMPLKAPPYSKTTVSVVRDDCVVAYEKLLNKGKRPLLLNMASATSPGGGYRKGDGAQEENLFRRSDYFRSLDVGLDDLLPQRPERLRCTSNGALEPLPAPHNMYPMEEFAAIYTSGLTFFRRSQDEGYEYLDRPMENVCAVAMAAYRDPKLEGKYLSSKYAIGTRKKIENVFAIAYHHNHDSIVLSAFGCGAFRNPPGHVADIFASVIDQYAGFFETIVFAIIDDHNAGQRLNPEGNYKPFVDILDGKVVTPITPMNKPNTMFGPYRISTDGSTVRDISIFDLTPCFYGAKCTDILNPSHTNQYSHPPLCAYAAAKGKCELTKDFVHTLSFIHRNQCQYGGECRNIDDKKHCQEVEHPSSCPDGGACQNMEQGHLKQFRHLPLCEYAQKCTKLKKHDTTHCNEWRHCQPRCPHGNRCINFHDKKHMTEEQHPFPTPCPRTPFHCPYYTTLSEAADTRTVPINIQTHCLDFAHVCRFGRNCMDNTPLHQEKSIHIARYLCPNDGKCLKLNQDEHLNSYTHSNIADIRRICKYADKCHERHKLEHTTKFRHARSHEDSGVVRYFGLNNNINFVDNQCDSITRILNYVKSQNWKPLPSGGVPREILDWFRTVQPVHRCSPLIFESILLHGHVMSRDYMENLKKPKFVATSVMQHARIQRIDNLKIPQIAQHAREYIIALVTAEFAKANFPPSDPPPVGAPIPPPPPPPPPPPHPSLASLDITIKSEESVLSRTISPKDFEALKTKAIEIAQASIELFTNPAGIGHPPDKVFGTHKRVFSILGPHLGHYYGDVFIVFKREILHHPDADFSMLAATTFGTSENAYKWRPWLGAVPVKPEDRVAQYHNTKLHASSPGYEYAIAMELMAITSNDMKLKSMDLNLDTLFKRWFSTDSHRTIEGHLPQLIPVDYIDHIYMPQNIFNSLSKRTHQSIEAVFKHCTTITPHQGAIGNAMGGPGPTPGTKDRADYQNHVVGELLKRYDRDIHHPPARPVQGAIITIPATNFDESFLLPLTISQAYEQYRFDKKQDPPDNIAYIYWQVMHGDMMLVLSNEPIEADKGQPNLRSLLCYIAPRSESSDTNYYEQTTYLNAGQPIQHHVFVNKSLYKGRSNTFHIGSNTDDFITYCLELHRSSGKVILRQAGSNAIYNHEEISCVFNKIELDITQLEFIHVTTGTKDVSVRNLIVCFEKQPDLHPTFDKTFKKSNPAAGKAPSGDPSHDGSSLKPCPENVNCLVQYETGASGTAHNSKFSHPCRYSELCRSKEPHLTHFPHPSPPCTYDKKCNRLTEPSHRADFRHTDLPDFLVPCRDKDKCSNKSDEHLSKYSHGEQVYKKKGADVAASSDHPPTDARPPCKYGLDCKTIADPKHRARFSHNK